MGNMVKMKIGKKRIGFTLIELLVVIAIIAILAGMLLPVLNSVREKGQRISCLNQMKQQGLAIFLYADSANDHFPPDWGGRTWENGTFDDNRIWVEMLLAATEIKGAGKISNGNFNRNSIFICPRAQTGWNITAGKIQNTAATSYALSSTTVMETLPPGNRYRLKCIREMAPYTSTRILTMDYKKYTVLYYDGSSPPYQTGIYEGTDHNGGKNLLFTDGHAAYMKYAEIPFGTNISTALRKQYYY